MISIYWPLIRSIQSGRCSMMSDTSASTQSIILSAGNLQGWQSSSRGCWMKLWKAKDAKALSNTTTTTATAAATTTTTTSLMFGGFNPSENTCQWKSSQIGNKGLSFNHIQYMYGTICNLGGPFGPGDIAAKFIHRLKRSTIEWTPKNVTCPVGAPMDWDQAVSSWAFGLLYHQHREQRPTCRAWLLEQKKKSLQEPKKKAIIQGRRSWVLST